MTIFVFGSINMDLVVRTPRFPAPGETITGHTFFTAPGGKGANQATAAAKLDISTRMIGRIGKDVFGQSLLASMDQNGVMTSDVTIDNNYPSGTALITINDAAENNIIYVPGANGAVGLEDVNHLTIAFKNNPAKSPIILMLQLEVPVSAVVAAAEAGRNNNATTIFDPAPVLQFPPELYQMIDIITPNETEASLLVGFKIKRIEDAERAANNIIERGVKQVIIKMGNRGAFWSNGRKKKYFPVFTVEAIDTVAAGDAFNGALASALHEGLAMEEALVWAMAGGALSTLKEGAQPSMPDRQSLLCFIENHSSELTGLN